MEKAKGSQKSEKAKDSNAEKSKSNEGEQADHKKREKRQEENGHDTQRSTDSSSKYLCLDYFGYSLIGHMS